MFFNTNLLTRWCVLQSHTIMQTIYKCIAVIRSKCFPFSMLQGKSASCEAAHEFMQQSSMTLRSASR